MIRLYDFKASQITDAALEVRKMNSSLHGCDFSIQVIPADEVSSC